MRRKRLNRRQFLQATAVGATAASLNAATYAQVNGANDRIGIAFLGVGGRCQQHIDVVTGLARQNRGVRPVAVNDVWDGNEQLSRGTGRGLYPSARKCGLDPQDRVHVTKDYRRLLELREVDAVCIATPDHWHAKMSIDAAAAGKHIYCEKPMTKTIDEAHAVVDAARRHNVVMTVGVQSMADPTWRLAHEMVRRGDIGHLCQAQTSYYRNSLVGQWRYYPLTRDMTPTTVDWDMFLGTNFSVMPGVPLAPPMPFDRAIFAQWRCYWQFGGGMFTDLFVHQTTHMIAAMGVRYPSRVVGAGGIYLEYDERDVPDVATVVADYDEGCQLIISATMINDYPLDEVIRGRLGTLKFVPHTVAGPNNTRTRRGAGMDIEMLPQHPSGRPTGPGAAAAGRGRLIPTTLDSDDTTALWLNFLDCCRTRTRETWSTPELGAAAFTTVNMGVQSYREGQVLFWDRDNRRPTVADSSWATRWEQRSRQRGTPNQIAGWAGGNRGSVVIPPDYQRLGGPWRNGQDPAPPATGSGGN
jgi:predicted dehydrogenase